MGPVQTSPGAEKVGIISALSFVPATLGILFGVMSLTRARPQREGFAASENGVVLSVCAAGTALIMPTKRCESELECAQP